MPKDKPVAGLAGEDISLVGAETDIKLGALDVGDWGTVRVDAFVGGTMDVWVLNSPNVIDHRSGITLTSRIASLISVLIATHTFFPSSHFDTADENL